MKTSMLLLAAVFAALVPATVQAVDDLHVIYEEGRAAFNAGEFQLAREKLAYVLTKNPTHLPTRAMMAQIERVMGVDNVMLRKSYEKIIIDRIEFADVELNDAITAVRLKAKMATNDKVALNLIIKNPELGKKIVSINLTQVPLTEVLHYLAQLAGGRLTYDKTAVMISSLTDVREPAVPTPAPMPAVVPGTATHRSPVKLDSPFGSPARPIKLRCRCLRTWHSPSEDVTPCGFPS